MESRHRCGCSYTLLALAKANRDYGTVACPNCKWYGYVSKVFGEPSAENWKMVRERDIIEHAKPHNST